MGGLIINYGKPCSVKWCPGVRLRNPKYCNTHVARVKKWGSLRSDLPVKFKNLGPGVITSLTYRTWAMMKNRCTNPNAEDWKYYGGRGIKLTHRWHDFRNFVKDMGERPNRSLTIDRINNDKGYSKTNCRWATKKQQRQNQRSVS